MWTRVIEPSLLYSLSLEKFRLNVLVNRGSVSVNLLPLSMRFPQRAAITQKYKVLEDMCLETNALRSLDRERIPKNIA